MCDLSPSIPTEIISHTVHENVQETDFPIRGMKWRKIGYVY